MSNSRINEDNVENPLLFTFWYLLIVSTLLVLSCYIFRRRRIIWCRRIRTCQWNVSTDDLDQGIGAVFTLRYPRGDPRHVPTVQDAEDAKKKFILEKLKGFTKVCNSGTTLKHGEFQFLESCSIIYSLLVIPSSIKQTIEESDFTTKKATDVDVVLGHGNGGMKSKTNQDMNRKSARSSLMGLLRPLSPRRRRDFAPEGPKEKNDSADYQLADDKSRDGDDDDVMEEGVIKVPPPSDDSVHTMISNLSFNTESKTLDNSSNSCLESTTPMRHENDKDSGESDDKTMVVLELPCPGISLNSDPNGACGADGSSNKNHVRCIMPECPICLNECKVGDSMVWSPHSKCLHAFHEECIMQWFLTLGRNSDERKRTTSYNVDFKLGCPVCRQDFICCGESASGEASTTGGSDDNV